MPKLSPSEYQELKSFLGFFSERFFNTAGLAPERRPLSLVESMESKAPARAAEGLRMAINDCLEMSSRWKPDRVRALDAELRQHKLVTLSELRRRYSRDYARVVKRGRINSEVEYYMAKGILDGGALDLKDNERHLLATMLQQYEQRAS
jgi:hypothetical protein